jgi:YfiH family protein
MTDAIEAIEAQLLRFPGIRHGFFTRKGGVSTGVYASLNGGPGSGDDPVSILENRARIAAHLGASPERLVGLSQIHSAICVTVDPSTRTEALPQADALVAATPGIALSISTADCAPILFADPIARVIGASHAGWRGALAGVAEATLAAMITQGAAIERIRIAIGPMLSQTHYEVGPEFRGRFLDEDPANARFFAVGTRSDHPQFDLPGYLDARLRRAGVTRIENSGLCTYADPARFYSYRRMTHEGERDYGRLIAAILIEA